MHKVVLNLKFTKVLYFPVFLVKGIFNIEVLFAYLNGHFFVLYTTSLLLLISILNVTNLVEKFNNCF